MSYKVAGKALPILCNQENVIPKANCYKMNMHYQDVILIIIKPSIKNSLYKGRPKNGMFIAIPSNFKHIIEDVSPSYWRIQAVTVKCSSVLVYQLIFPVNSRTMNFNEAELLETLNAISDILNHILWVVDINDDFI